MSRYFLALMFLTVTTLLPIAADPAPVRVDDASIATPAAPRLRFPTIAADQSRPSGVSTNLIDDPGPIDGNGTYVDICATGTAYTDQRCSVDSGTIYTCTSATARICKVVNEGTKEERCKTCFN